MDTRDRGSYGNVKNRMWGLLLLGAILTVPAQAQGARVKASHGAVEVRAGLHQTSPLAPNARLEDGTRLNLMPGSNVTLTFYKDGHQEILTGPCLARVQADGSQIVHGGSGCLQRVAKHDRILVMPQGGNLQSVGGAIAGISDPGAQKKTQSTLKISSSERRNTPVSASARRPISDASSISTASGGGGGGRAGRPIQAHAEPEPELVFQQQGGVPVVRVARGQASSLQLTLRGPNEERAVKATGDLIRLGALKVGGQYQLEVQQSGKRQQVVPFRVLTPHQETELARLMANESESEAAVVIDELERLGLPSLAAQQGEKLLDRLEGRDVGLMCYLHRLYSEVLQDSARAQRIAQRARDLGCDLSSRKK